MSSDKFSLCRLISIELIVPLLMAIAPVSASNRPCNQVLSRLENSTIFPPASTWSHTDELIVNASQVPLTLETTKEAYSTGLFWWRLPETTNFGWYSLLDRGILRYADLEIDRETVKALKNLIELPGEITINRAFDDVIERCSIPRNGSRSVPWLTNELKAIFKQLHREGFAHSIEVWGERDATGHRPLLAATYGTFFEGRFGGESVFTNKELGSHFGKLAVITALLHSASLNLNGSIDPESWIDIQTVSAGSYKADLGGKVITRDEFHRLMAQSDPHLVFAKSSPFSIDLPDLLQKMVVVRERNSKRRAAATIESQKAQKNPADVATKEALKEERRKQRKENGLPISLPRSQQAQ